MNPCPWKTKNRGNLNLLVTWNFKHMNNSALRGKIRSTITDAGWICPDICSPEEV